MHGETIKIENKHLKIQTKIHLRAMFFFKKKVAFNAPIFKKYSKFFQ
jgi:hypothetical protein